MNCSNRIQYATEVQLKLIRVHRGRAWAVPQPDSGVRHIRLQRSAVGKSGLFCLVKEIVRCPQDQQREELESSARIVSDRGCWAICFAVPRACPRHCAANVAVLALSRIRGMQRSCQN